MELELRFFGRCSVMRTVNRNQTTITSESQVFRARLTCRPFSHSAIQPTSRRADRDLNRTARTPETHELYKKIAEIAEIEKLDIS